VGRILQRIEDKGFNIAGMKLMQVTRELASKHYAPHQGKPFYDGLIEYITSGPVVVLVLEGQRAIEVSRKMMGKTFGYEADGGTIRGDFGVSKTFNLIHGSDSPESAETEIALYFQPGELLNYETATHAWTFKSGEV
jgi:nucleoside-diphosphate kinase